VPEYCTSEIEEISFSTAPARQFWMKQKLLDLPSRTAGAADAASGRSAGLIRLTNRVVALLAASFNSGGGYA
jgi:hypothetical protein